MNLNRKLTYAYPKEKVNPIEDLETILGPHWAKKVFESCVSNAAASVYGGSVAGGDGRLLTSVFSALDEATDGTVVLPDTTIDFLRGIFSAPQCRVPVGQIRLRVLIEDALSSAKE